jgi:hypothetical protein
MSAFHIISLPLAANLATASRSPPEAEVQAEIASLCDQLSCRDGPVECEAIQGVKLLLDGWCSFLWMVRIVWIVRQVNKLTDPLMANFADASSDYRGCMLQIQLREKSA